MDKIKKAIDTIRNMAANKTQNVNKFILTNLATVLERETSKVQKNNDFMCVVINKVSILSEVKINEEVDRIDAMEDLFDSFNELKKSCDKEFTTCHCGKKLPGIERA